MCSSDLLAAENQLDTVIALCRKIESSGVMSAAGAYDRLHGYLGGISLENKIKRMATIDLHKEDVE